MTKDFLAGLRVKWHPLLILELFSINKLGLNYGTYKNLLQTPKNLKLGLEISQRPVVVIVTISLAIISHILYRPVSHFCYALCPNPPAGKEKTSMTMQHAKEGKFIADSSQGPCCNQRSGAKSESPEPQFPRTFIGCSISNISSG